MQKVLQARAATRRNGLPGIALDKPALALWPWPVGGDLLSSASHLEKKKIKNKSYRPFRSACDILWVIFRKHPGNHPSAGPRLRGAAHGWAWKQTGSRKWNHTPVHTMNPSINKWACFSKRQLTHCLLMEKRRLGYRETEKWRAKKTKILSFCQQPQMESRLCRPGRVVLWLFIKMRALSTSWNSLFISHHSIWPRIQWENDWSQRK